MTLKNRSEIGLTVLALALLAQISGCSNPNPVDTTLFKILEDPAGDGFYIDVTRDNPRVFYHMLEDPVPTYFGTLPQFVEFLIRIHSAGITSVDQHGMILFDDKEYSRIEGAHLRSVGSL
jgi:hypothetical protein